MRPDKPGEWHSRDGRRILVQKANAIGMLRWRGVGGFLERDLRELEGDDWLPAVAPTFIELPPKPKVFFVLATRESVFDAPEWCLVANADYYYRPHAGMCGGTLKYLTIVPHDDNDPEAVQLIKEARHET